MWWLIERCLGKELHIRECVGDFSRESHPGSAEAGAGGLRSVERVCLKTQTKETTNNNIKFVIDFIFGGVCVWRGK